MSKPIKATLCCIALVGAAACTTNPAAEREATCVGGTVAGAAVGGLIGNQIGAGSGNALATAIGAMAGGAAAANSMEC